MEIAKVSSKGQITIPAEIRKKLNLKEGDKVLFLEEGNRIIVVNASYVALKEIQEEMKNKKEKAGIKTEEDVLDIVKEIREELWEKNYKSND
jgi:AbrB family looped-hinge helix DNA binding protein